MITDKLSAMQVASAALSRAQQESGALAGMYDPETGEPTGHSNGSLERMIVDVISESFDVEGQDGPAEAVRNIVKWFGEMGRELGQVEGALSHHMPADEALA